MRGHCILPDQCKCLTQFTGSNCSQCSRGRWGESCRPCPRCLHGTCNDTNGACDCTDKKWVGPLCDTCRQGLYGPNCLPYTTVEKVFPSSGPSTGGTLVHVSGHNFPPPANHSFYCKFGSQNVSASRISEGMIVCSTPHHQASEVTVEVSSDGRVFTQNETKFTFYAVHACPGSCGKTNTPPRGYCLFGDCVCILPWTGEDCDNELKAPVISSIKDVVLTEGKEYSIQPNITQGSPPLFWSLGGAPVGMNIADRSGWIHWRNVTATLCPYKLRVRASNRIGHSETQWSMTVKMSYSVTVEELTPSGILPTPKTIVIKGNVTFVNGPFDAVINVKIRNKGAVTTIATSTLRVDRFRFEAVYYPKAGDSGLFEVDASHPANDNFTAQMSWSVLGVRCVPSHVSRQAYLDTEITELRDVAVLRNVGVDTVNNITTAVGGVGGPLSSVVVKTRHPESTNSSQTLIESLFMDAEICFDLILRATRPFRGTIAVIFTGDKGTTAEVIIQLQMNAWRPVLVPVPGSLTEAVPRGRQRTFQIDIANEGDVPARHINVSLPAEPRLSLATFSSARGQSSDDGLTLGPGEKAVLILTVTSREEDSLGEFSGKVSLNSDLSSASISYRFYLTSLTTMNVTVRVEDEYTYFASERPLVAGALVTLMNSRRAYREQRITTNRTEFLIFEDVQEDQYTLTATAPGHASYSAIIIAKPSKPSFTIFLQRVAVRWTWTVTPTAFTDKYTITMESKFETQVPMPVVIVDPVLVDITPYESGHKDSIDFKVTNHGLIAANNLRFVLPENHPTLIFEQQNVPLGDLDANTSIIVPVQVKARYRFRRNTSGFSRQLAGKLIELQIVEGVLDEIDWTELRAIRQNILKMLAKEKNVDTIEAKLRTMGKVGIQIAKPSLKVCQDEDTIINMLYDYVCGERKTGLIPIILTHLSPLVRATIPGNCAPSERPHFPWHPRPFFRPRDRIPPLGPSVVIGPPEITKRPPSTPNNCELVYTPTTPLGCNCANSLMNCDFGISPIKDCLSAAFVDAVHNKGFFKKSLAVLDLVFCVLPFLCPAEECMVIRTIWNLAKCVTSVVKNCVVMPSDERVKNIMSDSTTESIPEDVRRLGRLSTAVTNLLSILKETFGGEDVFDMYDSSWIPSFKMALGEESPAGNFLSMAEMTSLVSPLNTSQHDIVQRFLQRWNNTMAAWNNHSLVSKGPTDNVISYHVVMSRFEQFKTDTGSVSELGYHSIFEAFYNSSMEYKNSRTKTWQNDGVCATVRIHIVQEMVLTRQAFTAKLEFENGERSPLENIMVELDVKSTYGNGSSAVELFSFGTPKLVGISGVNGTGRLEKGGSGTAEWLIVPYSRAAVKEDTRYDVGGRLTYTVGGSDLTVPLLSDTITVTPNPSLIVNYFHEKYVQGDDPLTIEKEAVVPFTLAVMVTNGAYGVARQLQITSARPEIIENEKGLLVAFKIIGTQLGKTSITPSLTINFGDIQPMETTTARWLLTSPLRGQFYNYSAHFRNINPLGDPELSVFENVFYHELIHLVTLESSDDELDGFLVNNVPDKDEMPDKVYGSSDGFKSYQVATTNVLAFTKKTQQHDNGKYIFTNLSITIVSSLTATYGYTRFVNNVTANTVNETLLQVTRQDGNGVLIGNNAWQTDYYHDRFYLHLFDLYNSSSFPLKTSYTVVFGPRNVHAPTFASKFYNVTISQDPPGGHVTTIVAEDKDFNTVLTYSITPTVLFTVDERTGAIRNTAPLEVSVYFLTLKVKDDGIPPLNSSTRINVTVTDRIPLTSSVSKATEYKGTTESPKSTTQVVSQATETTSQDPQSSQPISVSTQGPQSSQPTSVSTQGPQSSQSISVSTQNPQSSQLITVSTQGPQSTEPISVSTQDPQSSQPISISTQGPQSSQPTSVSTQGPQSNQPVSVSTQGPQSSQPISVSTQDLQSSQPTSVSTQVPQTSTPILDCTQCPQTGIPTSVSTSKPISVGTQGPQTSKRISLSAQGLQTSTPTSVSTSKPISVRTQGPQTNERISCSTQGLQTSTPTSVGIQGRQTSTLEPVSTMFTGRVKIPTTKTSKTVPFVSADRTSKAVTAEHKTSKKPSQVPETSTSVRHTDRTAKTSGSESLVLNVITIGVTWLFVILMSVSGCAICMS